MTSSGISRFTLKVFALLLLNLAVVSTRFLRSTEENQGQRNLEDNLRALKSYKYDQFITYSEIETRLKLLEKAYPDLIKVRIVGQSAEGRNLYLAIVTSPFQRDTDSQEVSAENPQAEVDSTDESSSSDEEVTDYNRRGAKRMPVNVIEEVSPLVQRIIDKNIEEYLTFSQRAASKPVIFIDGGIHAREWAAPAAALNLIEKLVKDPALTGPLEWRIFPLVNPDGYIYTFNSRNTRFWRKNRKKSSRSRCSGVDLNRNFDVYWHQTVREPCSIVYGGSHVFSEPESRALRDAVNEVRSRTKAYVTIHSYGQYILYPYGYTRTKRAPTRNQLMAMGDGMAQEIYDTYGTAYIVDQASILGAAAGGSDDWAYMKAGIPYSYTLEMQPSANRGLKGFDLPAWKLPQAVDEVWLALSYLGHQIKAEFRTNTLTQFRRDSVIMPTDKLETASWPYIAEQMVAKDEIVSSQNDTANEEQKLGQSGYKKKPGISSIGHPLNPDSVQHSDGDVVDTIGEAVNKKQSIPGNLDHTLSVSESKIDLLVVDPPQDLQLALDIDGIQTPVLVEPENPIGDITNVQDVTALAQKEADTKLTEGETQTISKIDNVPGTHAGEQSAVIDLASLENMSLPKIDNITNKEPNVDDLKNNKAPIDSDLAKEPDLSAGMEHGKPVGDETTVQEGIVTDMKKHAEPKIKERESISKVEGDLGTYEGEQSTSTDLTSSEKLSLSKIDATSNKEQKVDSSENVPTPKDSELTGEDNPAVGIEHEKPVVDVKIYTEPKIENDKSISKIDDGLGTHVGEQSTSTDVVLAENIALAKIDGTSNKAQTVHSPQKLQTTNNPEHTRETGISEVIKNEKHFEDGAHINLEAKINLQTHVDSKTVEEATASKIDVGPATYGINQPAVTGLTSPEETSPTKTDAINMDQHPPVDTLGDVASTGDVKVSEHIITRNVPNNQKLTSGENSPIQAVSEERVSTKCEQASQSKANVEKETATHTEKEGTSVSTNGEIPSTNTVKPGTESEFVQVPTEIKSDVELVSKNEEKNNGNSVQGSGSIGIKGGTISSEELPETTATSSSTTYIEFPSESNAAEDGAHSTAQVDTHIKSEASDALEDKISPSSLHLPIEEKVSTFLNPSVSRTEVKYNGVTSIQAETKDADSNPVIKTGEGIKFSLSVLPLGAKLDKTDNPVLEGSPESINAQYYMAEDSRTDGDSTESDSEFDLETRLAGHSSESTLALGVEQPIFVDAQKDTYLVAPPTPSLSEILKDDVAMSYLAGQDSPIPIESFDDDDSTGAFKTLPIMDDSLMLESLYIEKLAPKVVLSSDFNGIPIGIWCLRVRLTYLCPELS